MKELQVVLMAKTENAQIFKSVKVKVPDDGNEWHVVGEMLEPLISDEDPAKVMEKKEKEDKYAEERKEIINYLNLVCNSRYRPGSQGSKGHINARLREGYTVDDFKSVIDKKHKEWTGTDMERFLTPDTLFGTKFEKYVNQTVSNRKSANKTAEMLNESYDMMANWAMQKEMEDQDDF